MPLRKPAPSLAAQARRELVARALDDAVVADCVKAATRPDPGAKLPRRVLMQALKRLYQVGPGFRQLDAAVAVVHQGVKTGYVSRTDRRRAFLGLALVATPALPASIYALWNRRLKGQGLKVGQLQQIVDLHKVARGEHAADCATRYLRSTDWKPWPPEDRRIWELTYVDGLTVRAVARELGGVEKSYVWARLAVHQHRAGIPSSGTIDRPTRLPYAGPEDVELTAQPTGGSRRGAGDQDDRTRVGGFSIRDWREDS